MEDASAAIDNGADLLGFIFVPTSPRAILLTQAENILRVVQGKARVVGVFMDSPLADVVKACDQLHLDLVQLHGSESPDYCDAVPVPVIKRVKIKCKFSNGPFTFYDVALSDVAAYRKANIQYLLLEPGKGKPPCDWEKVRLPPDMPPYFLAGGLTPANVTSVVDRFWPDGVDVASGVEESPGVKSVEKLRAFCKAATSPPT